jgi:hypothetical protein
MRATNDVRKLLAWLEGAPVPEAQIVAAGFNHTLAISITPSREGADAEFRRVESPSSERIITVIPCQAAEYSPKLQIRTTQLQREGSPPPGLHHFRRSCHEIPIR